MKEYKFVDEVNRKDTENKIKEMQKEGYDVVSICGHNNHYRLIGILFVKE